MPTKRKLRKKSVVAQLDEITEDQKEKASPWKNLRPYEGRDKLKMPEVNKAGRATKVFKRYYITNMALMETYIAREGAVRRICKYTFKSRPKDKQIRKALKKIGIPGA